MRIELGHNDRATTEFAQQVKNFHRVSPVGARHAKNRQNGEELGNPTSKNPSRDDEGGGFRELERCSEQLRDLQEKVVHLAVVGDSGGKPNRVANAGVKGGGM